jgi:hypothetical protein
MPTCSAAATYPPPPESSASRPTALCIVLHTTAAVVVQGPRSTLNLTNSNKWSNLEQTVCTSTQTLANLHKLSHALTYKAYH